jgi:cytosine/adenosine deaminase-related metal-dependent hydrolase
MRRWIWFLAAGMACPAAAAEPGTSFIVIVGGNRAGTMRESSAAPERRDFDFEFNDRGRGPKITESVTLSDDGIPSKIVITGNDYLKNAVDERFSLAAGTAQWKSDSEQGTRAVSAPSFYITANGAPAEFGLLASALLRAPRRRLALLPEGEASIERIAERQVTSGGAGRRVSLCEITGLGFEPTPVWLDEKNEFFASVDPWFSVVPEGWDGVEAELLAAQRDRANSRSADDALRLGRKPPGGLAIRNATLFDVETGTLHPRTTVVVAGDRIRSVGPDGSVAIPPGAETVDAAGRTLMPGLWDMHQHLSGVDGLLDIANGITTARDLANDTENLLAMKKRFDEGSQIGPRIILAGIVDGPGPYQGPTKVLVSNEDEARRAVENYARLGYVQLKIYSSIKPELMPYLARLAHEHGMRVSGHVPAFMTAEQFVLNGADEIQHENFVFLNFLFDKVQDTRTPARFTAIAENARDIVPWSEPVRRFLALLKGHGTVLDPTINVFEEMLTARKGLDSPEYAAISSRFPPQIRRQFLAGGLPVPEGKDQLYRDSFRSMLRMLRAIHDEGIRIVAGTDALAGFSLVRELELYEQAGIPTPEILRIATLGAAEVMKMDRETGSIAPGKAADLIIVGGDPVSRVADLRKVDTVIKGGVVYRAADLDRAIGVAPVVP